MVESPLLPLHFKQLSILIVVEQLGSFERGRLAGAEKANFILATATTAPTTLCVPVVALHWRVGDL